MLTIISFVFFTALVGFLTYIITRKDNVSSKEGFFLAGRSLTFPVIAGSLLLTNLSTEQMVGLNGSAFKGGLSLMVWEVVAVVGLVFMAWFFLPRFLKSGVATVPEYLNQRFGEATGMLTNLIFLVAYTLILLPIILYTGAQGLGEILDVGRLTGISDPVTQLAVVVVFVGIIGSVYALFGGLRTVAVSDTINGIGLLIGGFMIVFFALDMVSGHEGVFKGYTILKTSVPEHFNSIGGNNAEVPFGAIFSGVLLINLFYWCTNQQIIQRTFGASSLAEGQKGVLLTGFLKLLGPIYLVIPGIIAFYFWKEGIIELSLNKYGDPQSAEAYGTLVRKVLPGPLTGFFAAVMIGAILSSFNSALNSTCTLFSLGVYQKIIRPTATEREVVRSGRIFGWIVAIMAMFIAPMLMQTSSIFDYLQNMNAIYFIPILAVVVVGMLSRRVPGNAAKWALIIGVLLILAGNFLPPFTWIAQSIGGYTFQGIVFLYLVMFMLVYGEVKPLAKPYVPIDAKVVNMTPWKHTMKAGAALLILVVLIYAAFADFSVLKNPDKPAATSEVVEELE